MSLFDSFKFQNNKNSNEKVAEEIRGPASKPIPEHKQQSNSLKYNTKYDTTRLSGFDPSMLERGAQAMKKIQDGGHGEKILDLLAQQEVTKQLQIKERTSQHRKQAAEIEAQNIQRKSQEERRSIHNRAEKERSIAQNRANIETEKQKELQRMQMEANQEQLDRQNKMFEQQQEYLRKVEKQKMDNEIKLINERGKRDILTAQAREEAKARGNIKRERQNFDIDKEKIALKSEMENKLATQLQDSRHNFILNYTNNIFNLLTDYKKTLSIACGATALFTGYFASKNGLIVLRRYIEMRLGRPSLVRETSRVSYLNPFQALKNNWIQFNVRRQKIFLKDALFKGMIVCPKLQNKLSQLATSTQNTSRYNAPYQNFVFHGNPGTGKTLFAKKLAISSGLDYAIMAGGDFAPLGKDVVTELHKVFDQAEKSKRGTLIFIDEAEAFLRKGRGEAGTMGEDMRNALSAYLYRTGASSTKFMIILATNLPHTLDSAVRDRIDEFVHFPLPEMQERKKLFQYYIQQNVIDPVKSETKTDSCRNKLFHCLNINELDRLYEILARKTEGLSGRTICKFVTALRASIYGGRFEKIGVENAQIIVDELLKSNSALR